MKRFLIPLTILFLSVGFAACDDDTNNNNSECETGDTQNGDTICGFNDQGVFVEECTDGVWADTATCVDSDECTNDATQTSTVSCNDTGWLIQDCTEGQWVDSSNCTVGGCVENATQDGTVLCGLNDRGIIIQECDADGVWIDTEDCNDSDTCLDDETQEGTTVCNGDGVLLQDCTVGQWVDSSDCTIGGCVFDATQVGITECGENLEGHFSQLCVTDTVTTDATENIWEDTTTCDGTHVCVNDATQIGTNDCNGSGDLYQLCTVGEWVDTVECTIGGCTFDATQVGSTVCGYNDEGHIEETCVTDTTPNATENIWEDNGTCDGTHVCENNTTQEGSTACNGAGVYYQDCLVGEWIDNSTCSVDACIAGEHNNGTECIEDITISDCHVSPSSATLTVDTTLDFYANFVGTTTTDGTVTGSGTENISIDALFCFTDESNVETCVDAVYNTSCASCNGERDEFMIIQSFDASGIYEYDFFISGNMGITWDSCDGTHIATVSPGMTPLGKLVINEIDYDQPGGDTMEFVEIFNGTSAAIDLTPLALVFINGSGEAEYARVDLVDAGSTLAPGQYLVVGQPALIATVPVSALSVEFNGGVQNGGPDGVVLIDTSDNSVIDALSYEGSITAADITGFSSSVSLVEGTATSIVDNTDGSIVRFPNGSDTDDASIDWDWTTIPTPGLPNTINL
jgi:Lamin Tail Domain